MQVVWRNEKNVAQLKLFSISFFVDERSSQQLIHDFLDSLNFLLTFPIVSGSSGAGSIAFQGAVTDYTFGSPDIQARINGEMTITCSGLPVVTAGT